jgi:hypothetical protein
MSEAADTESVAQTCGASIFGTMRRPGEPERRPRTHNVLAPRGAAYWIVVNTPPLSSNTCAPTTSLMSAF